MTPNVTRVVPPTWNESATVDEVREFALQALSNGISEYFLGLSARDARQMENAVRIIRNVSTRLDQFRRMKQKQWATPAAPHTQAEKGTT